MKVEVKDYWMSNIVKGLVQEQKQRNYKNKFIEHKDCSWDCENRWCANSGQLNLIIKKINEEQGKISENLMRAKPKELIK